jgi:hypothetical protein
VQALLVIAIVTFLAIGIAIAASLPSRAIAAEDEDHTRVSATSRHEQQR